MATLRSNKQVVVVRSNANAKFKAMEKGIYKLLWLKTILCNLGVRWKATIKLYHNKKSIINIAHNPIQHDCIKHVEVDQCFIKEKIDSGLHCTPYVSTDG